MNALVEGLVAQGIKVTCKTPAAHPRIGLILHCVGDGLTQDIALGADPDRPQRWLWWWLWADGLRGEGPITPERMALGEEIAKATFAVVKVLAVRVAV